MKKRVSFEVSINDATLIAQIVVRAASMLGGFERIELAMDLHAVHANGCALDFAGLLAADDFNFCHDIRGIQAHLDRRSGKLKEFEPRFAAHIRASETRR